MAKKKKGWLIMPKVHSKFNDVEFSFGMLEGVLHVGDRVDGAAINVCDNVLRQVVIAEVILVGKNIGEDD